MKIPVIQGVIRRRILVNYRVNPDVLAAAVPAPFEPMLVEGHGIGGICLIGLTKIKPKGFPFLPGLSSENAAHRIAVTWHEEGREQNGVFIPRRDTNSRLASWAGGRVFPGIHSIGTFKISDTSKSVEISFKSDDGVTSVAVKGRPAKAIRKESVFASTQAASDFFEAGHTGYSVTRQAHRYDGLDLRCQNWHVEPFDVDHVQSSYFEDQSRFPAGSVEFDSALLMRNIDHEWHSVRDLCCEGKTAG